MIWFAMFMQIASFPEISKRLFIRCYRKILAEFPTCSDPPDEYFCLKTATRVLIVAIFNNFIYIPFNIYIYEIFFHLFNLIFIYIEYSLNPFNLIWLYLFNLIALYPFNLIHIYSFNSIWKNIYLISGTGSSHRIRKKRGWERIIARS